jgi:hypothetical protein
MNLPSSSTSSSDVATRKRSGGALRACLWAFFWLATLDVAINVLFAYPTDPRITSASQLKLYFDYGRSTEAKLARMTRAEPARSAPITLVGWYDPLMVQELPGSDSALAVTFYGMSHAMRLASALERTTDKFTVRKVGAPGATANWAYGAYLRDREQAKSKVAVLALMSANLPMITTMSPMTWNVSFPMPHTADRFLIDDGDRLRAIHPPYTSFEQYVRTLNDSRSWAAARNAIAEGDPIYSPFVMQASLLDYSSVFRLIRRAYGQRIERSERRKVIGPTGFNPGSEQIKVANAIIKEFAIRARSDGVLPVIFLVNNLGYSDSLYQAVRSVLESNKIPYVSSHDFVSPRDPRGYLPDSHFKDEIDDRMARKLVQVIDASR